jgi:hypothetical protein
MEIKMRLSPNAGNGKRPILSVTFPYIGGRKTIELTDPLARHVLILGRANAAGGRIPPAPVQRMIEMGLDIIRLTDKDHYHYPPVYQLLSPIEAAWME